MFSKYDVVELLKEADKIFSPSAPIKKINEFAGREEEISRMLSHLETPGQHSLVFGVRGIGKSSLANIVVEKMKNRHKSGGFCVIKHTCGKDDKFVHIVNKILNRVHINNCIEKTEYTTSTSGKIEGGIKLIATGSAAHNRGKTTTMKGNYENSGRPSWVVDKIKDLEGIFHIDEIDVIKKEEGYKIAEMMKLLSEAHSKLSCLVVGVAETAEVLHFGHGSVDRQLKETELEGMTNEEIKAMIGVGEKLFNDYIANKYHERYSFKKYFLFQISYTKRLPLLCSGYPSIAKMIAQYSIKLAIADRELFVKETYLNRAAEESTKSFRATLENIYTEATRSKDLKRKKGLRTLLMVAAQQRGIEFSKNELRDDWNRIMNGNSCNFDNMLTKIVSDTKETVLTRVVNGVYKFNDPRMRAFINLKNSKQIQNTSD